MMPRVVPRPKNQTPNPRTEPEAPAWRHVPRRTPSCSVGRDSEDHRGDPENSETGCSECERPVNGGGAVRLRFGQALYKKRGLVFAHYVEDPVVWMHGSCAVKAGVNFRELSLDRCQLCGDQFFPDETAAEFALGIHNGTLFSPERIGYVHWACACGEYRLSALDEEQEEEDGNDELSRELNKIYSLVCPSCKARLRGLLS